MDRDKILKVAKLCKLTLTEEEIEKFSVEFKEFFDYFKQLSEVNTDNIEAYLTPVTENLREDDLANATLVDKDIALSLSSNHNDDYYLVPKVSLK